MSGQAQARVAKTPRTGLIVVASQSVTDATMIKTTLDKEYDNVTTWTDADDALAACEREAPAVLVLAFDTLDKSQRYYLNICRHSQNIHRQPHRTLLLCGQADVRQAYDLCREQLFDDYILFWPMTHDALRLPMAVHIALRELAASRGDQPTVAEFAGASRRLQGLGALLERQLALGAEYSAGAGDSVEKAERAVDQALEQFSAKISQGLLGHGLDSTGVGGLENEIGRIRREEIRPRFRSVADSISPVSRWTGDVAREVQPHLKSVRSLQALTERVRAIVLVVDDDEFQREIVAGVLADEAYVLVFAASGAEALAVLRKQAPDLILMDMMMPGMDGAEVTRRVRALPQFATVPIIMMTGESKGDVVSASIRAGATHFIVKPMKRETLIDKIAHALRSRKATEGPSPPRAADSARRSQ